MVDTQTAVVPIQSGWFSKINWTQAVQAFAMVAVLVSGGKFNITPDQQVALVVTIGVIGNFATIILRQFYNGTVTKQSLPK